MIQPTLINLHPNEYSQEFHYYPFSVKLDRCAGSCNTLNDLSGFPSLLDDGNEDFKFNYEVENDDDADEDDDDAYNESSDGECKDFFIIIIIIIIFAKIAT